MKSHKSKELTDSIVVWPDDLKYLDNFLKKTFTKIEYEASCEDDTKLKPESLSDLLEYENPDFKRVSSITINAYTEPSNDKVEIQIGKAGFMSNKTGIISLSFSDVRQQQPIEDEIIKRIKTMRPWYSWLNRISFRFIMPSLLFIFWIIVNANNLIKKFNGNIPVASAQPSPLTEGESQVLMLGVLGILFLCGFLIDRSRDYLFPKSFICIGRQLQSFEKRRKISYIIFGVIILGIIINIAASMLYQPFSK
jgi:hypothetical protein